MTDKVFDDQEQSVGCDHAKWVMRYLPLILHLTEVPYKTTKEGDTELTARWLAHLLWRGRLVSVVRYKDWTCLSPSDLPIPKPLRVRVSR